MSQRLDALRRTVKRDAKYRRFRDTFEGNPNYSIDFQKLHDELERMHMTRSVRTLRRKKVGFVDDLLDAMLQDQAVRSRTTEILGICVNIDGAMRETLDNLNDYLMVQYSESLKISSTQTERKAFIGTCLRQFYRYLDQIQQLREHCKLIVDDIDKAGYTYRNLVETVKILSKPEQVVL